MHWDRVRAGVREAVEHAHAKHGARCALYSQDDMNMKVLAAEVGEVAEALLYEDPTAVFGELLQVAAVAQMWACRLLNDGVVEFEELVGLVDDPV